MTKKILIIGGSSRAFRRHPMAQRRRRPSRRFPYLRGKASHLYLHHQPPWPLACIVFNLVSPTSATSTASRRVFRARPRSLRSPSPTGFSDRLPPRSPTKIYKLGLVWMAGPLTSMRLSNLSNASEETRKRHSVAMNRIAYQKKNSSSS